MRLPRHISLSIEHNEHRGGGYTSVEDYLDFNDISEWAAEGERERAIATQELWTCQWYPDTPVGSCLLSAASLDVLLKALADIE